MVVQFFSTLWRGPRPPAPAPLWLRLWHQGELLNVAIRHKDAPQERKCRAAVRHSLVYGGSFLWSLCSAKHAEHAEIRLSEFLQLRFLNLFWVIVISRRRHAASLLRKHVLCSSYILDEFYLYVAWSCQLLIVSLIECHIDPFIYSFISVRPCPNLCHYVIQYNKIGPNVLYDTKLLY